MVFGPRNYFTFRRGTIESRSTKQHRFFHSAKIDHVHVMIADGRKRIKRETWSKAEQRVAKRRTRLI